MANETIGKLIHHCDTVADVRKDRRGKLYLMCPNCGQLKYNLPGGQNYILEKATMFDENGNFEVPTEFLDKAAVNVTEKPGKFEKVKLEKEKPVTENKAPVKEKAGKNNGIGSMEL